MDDFEFIERLNKEIYSFRCRYYHPVKTILINEKFYKVCLNYLIPHNIRVLSSKNLLYDEIICIR